VTRNAGNKPLVEPALAEALSDLVAQASQAILTVLGSGLATRLKHDNSPVTNADHAADAILLEGLARLLPGVPVVSEESVEPGLSAAQLASTFVLVDPLDGTRELVAGRDEYTVNVALIVEGLPAFGIVAAPAAHVLWRGGVGGAEKLRIDVIDGIAKAIDARRISARRWPTASPIALVSRSHADARTATLLDGLAVSNRDVCGSSVKFCRLAEGTADLYPRLSPISEWDIAAGHAILAAAGGTVVAADGATLTYGHPGRSFLVPPFLALGDSDRAGAVLRAAAAIAACA
jgi:3'(2'), 5'-bisphosphate nucleotidase